MIAHLQGTVLRLMADQAVVSVQGVGYLVSITARLRRELSPGHELKLHVHTHVREDQLSLFGFPSVEELELFKLLLGVEGVGPRSAQQILSANTPESLRRAILADDTKLLRAMPGIGPKTAARMVIELKTSLGAGAAMPELSSGPALGAALEVLTGLGYQQGEARQALAELNGDGEEMSTEQAVAAALRRLDRG